MFTSTLVSTDAGSSITQVRLMLVDGLSPTRTTDVCADSIPIEDIGGTAEQYDCNNYDDS